MNNRPVPARKMDSPDRFNGHNGNGHQASGKAESVRYLAVTVPIRSLLPADSPRLGGLDAEHARTLAQIDTELPPILVRRSTMRVIDGMHRLRAAELRGQTTIGVQFFDGSEEDAFLIAVEANIAHGLPLTIAERRAAAARIIRSRPDLSDRSIAITSGLAARTVASIRRSAGGNAARLPARLGRDGRVRPLSAAEGRRLAGAMLVDEPELSLRKIAKRAGISVGTARDVRERVRRGEDPTLPGQRGRNAAEETPQNGRPVPLPPRQRTENIDPAAILENLRRDPALRYTEKGRSVLRWLAMRAVRTADWVEIVDHIPPHCAIVVARAARAVAAAWIDFANALERRIEDYA